AVRLDVQPHLLNCHCVCEQLFPVRGIAAIEAGMRGWRAWDREMTFRGAGIANQLDDLLRSRPAHDRIVHQHDALSLQNRSIWIVLEPDAEMANALRGLDESAANIMVADDAELEG